MKILYFISVIYLIIFLSDAHAYLDPGSGSIILTAIISFIAIMSLKIKTYFQKIKDFFKKNIIKK